MRAVLDANVALKWELAEVDSVQALRLRDEWLQQTHEFMAPDVFPIEVAHALTRSERKGLLAPSETLQGMRRVLQLLPALHASLTLLPRAFEISSKARIGVYDCLYLALAERERCPLITADSKLRVFPQVMLLADAP